MPEMTKEQRYDADVAVIERLSNTVSGFNLDANESIYFARQLEFIRAKIYDTKRPPLSALETFPIDREVPEWAEKVTYRMYDATSVAKIIASYADDLPMVGLSGKEFSSTIKTIGNAYGWDVMEVQAAARAQLPLKSTLAMTAKRGHDMQVNKIAWFGDSIANLPGFLSNTNIPIYTIPANGTGSSKLWSTKTPDQILDDLNGIVNAVLVQSKGFHRVTEVWMPIDKLAFIKNKIRGSQSDATIWKVWTDANPGIALKGKLELTAVAGSPYSGADVMVAIENSIENLQLILPMPFKELPPQAENLSFKVPCMSRVGGVVIEYPLSMTIAYGM